MIKNISISNFKSIKNLDFEARRVNIFIGEPNTGKSNILEALGILGLGEFGNLHDFVRYTYPFDLFNDSSKINITIEAFADNQNDELGLNGDTQIIANVLNSKHKLSVIKSDRDNRLDIDYNFEGEEIESKLLRGDLRAYTRFYKFDANRIVDNKDLLSDGENLLIPYGNNLFDILLGNEHIRELISEIFLQKGHELSLNLNSRNIEIIKQKSKNLTTVIPFSNISDTLQRVSFYLSAILSNKNSSLIFEEPESHIFPFYNQYLAELIGLDEISGNQYFIATHNPYFLASIAQKTKIKDLAVFITYMENHETKLRPMREDEYPELFDFDIFYNLDTFIQS